MQEQFTLTITLMDGQSMSFDFTPERGAEWSRGTKAQQLLNATMLSLETEGKLILLPTCNIRSIEISPPPAGIPGTISNLRPLT